jgi:polysaccharide export outer membrane protein
MNFPTFARLAPLFLAAICLGGCATGNAPQKPQSGQIPAPSQQAPADMRPDSMLVLRQGDSLEIRIGGVPGEEITQVGGTYVVDTEGFVNMPHIGRIKAAGLSQDQLQTVIEGTYRKMEIYTNPSITVNVPMQARFVNVGGEVRLPQRVAYTSDLTIMSALSAAGGLTEYASQARVHLTRGGQVETVDIRKVRKNPSLDISLQPGDSIEVMRSFF